MSKIRRILCQIPLLIIWLMASGLIWGFVFTRITDTDPAHKIAVYIDAETPGAAELATRLDDLKRGGIRMVQARPFTYAMLDGSSLASTDLFIVRASDMTAYRDWFAPCPDGFRPESVAWEDDSVRYGIPVINPLADFQPLVEYVSFEPSETYYLCFGKDSLHLAGNAGAVDNEAQYFADILLSGSF